MCAPTSTKETMTGSGMEFLYFIEFKNLSSLGVKYYKHTVA